MIWHKLKFEKTEIGALILTAAAVVASIVFGLWLDNAVSGYWAAGATVILILVFEWVSSSTDKE
jgi:hypothetical protein